MKLAIIADRAQQEAVRLKPVGEATLIFADIPANIPADVQGVIDLLFENKPDRLDQLSTFLPRPVFINAVDCTLAALQYPFIRVNGWPGFIEKDIIEVAVLPAQEAAMRSILNSLAWPHIIAPDIPGLVSPRIIAMLVNEAYFALGEELSTPEEIDLAMKAGTNYPYGPFEWSNRIGIQKIYDLLIKMAGQNTLYQIADILKKAAGH